GRRRRAGAAGGAAGDRAGDGTVAVGAATLARRRSAVLGRAQPDRGRSRLARSARRSKLEPMNRSFGNDDPALEAWLARAYQPEDEVLREIRERSRRAGLPDIQVAGLDARHLEVLTRLVGARRAVEIGTLGGYSGVSIL